MLQALSIIGIAFAAFSVWLTIRFINRRERWTKWTLVAVLWLPVLYVGSFGPALCLNRRDWISVETLCSVYGPMVRCFHRSPSGLKRAMICSWNLGGASEIELFLLLSDGQHDILDPDNWSATSGREAGRN